jgi:large repetitive protein
MLSFRPRFVSLVLSFLTLLVWPVIGGAQTAQFSYALFTLGGGFTGITSAALDGNGNVYITDLSAGAVKEIPPGCTSASCVKTLASGFIAPNGVAVDGKGDVFVATLGSVDGPGAPPSEDGGVYEIVAVNGSIPATSPTVLTLGSGFNGPGGVAVDGNGNVFVADTYNNAVKEILAAGGYTTVNILGSGFKSPFGVAVDASGDVFVADSGNSAVKEMLAVSGAIPASPTINTLSSGFNGPAGVAVDASGNLFVADVGLSSDSTLYEILAVDGSIPATSPTVVTVFNGVYSTIALDGTGDIFFNSGGSGLTELATQAANFGTVAVGQTTAAVPLTFTFTSGGSIGAPEALTLGATGLDFAVASGGTCTSGASFGSGDTCTLNVTFTPKYPGVRNGAAVLTDGSGNTIASAFVHGLGSGPQAGFALGTDTILSNPYIGI